MSKKILFQNISIILKPSHIDDLSNVVTHLSRWLSRRGHNVWILDKEYDRLESILSTNTLKTIEFKNDDIIYKKSDLVISLGGDGTLIGICRKISPTIPIVGINLGRLGFITEFNKTDIYDYLNEIFAGNYQITKQQLFSAKVFKNKECVFEEVFFNDAVIGNTGIARMFTLSVDSNNEHIFNIAGDGLIVSTPVGSTAYSLAAGGPIVHPNVHALILTPICPHGLTHRPLVIDDGNIITIQLITDNHPVRLTLDGQKTFEIDNKLIIEISKNKKRCVSIIKNPSRGYFHTLKEKFVHGRREYF